MPDTYRVRLTATAGAHLQEIYDYIEQQSPQNATTMIRRLVDSTDGLQQFPHRFAVVASSESSFGVEVRSMPVRPFRVRYHVNDAILTVTILSVQHGSRQDES
jgi:plasmid stabilization system protein ParE